ncbi:MAG: GxxExxY protein [Fusobacteriaceae bacterium]|nr:GxxExxY protein [Fusobacteriaceae bacterium]
MTNIVYKELSYKIIGIAMEVHNTLGGGFLEKVYENSMMILFEENNLNAKNQVKIDVFFKGKVVGDYFADILVDDIIIIELKTVEKISDIHRAQLFNYLKATNKKLGIIINFKNKKLEYERIVL